MRTTQQQTGKRAEDHVVQYLASKNCQLHARNFRFRKGEVDIIAEDKGTLAFIEVKARRTHGFGYPEQAVTTTQKDNYRSVAERYLVTHSWEGPIRFDIIALSKKGSQWELLHLQDAFY